MASLVDNDPPLTPAAGPLYVAPSRRGRPSKRFKVRCEDCYVDMGFGEGVEHVGGLSASVSVATKDLATPHSFFIFSSSTPTDAAGKPRPSLHVRLMRGIGDGSPPSQVISSANLPTSLGKGATWQRLGGLWAFQAHDARTEEWKACLITEFSRGMPSLDGLIEYYFDQLQDWTANEGYSVAGIVSRYLTIDPRTDVRRMLEITVFDSMEALKAYADPLWHEKRDTAHDGHVLRSAAMRIIPVKSEVIMDKLEKLWIQELVIAGG